MVSIVIPYKEDRGYLGEALNSIHSQTYKDFEILPEPSDNSVGYNMNQGIKKAKGKYICYLCDDDLLTKNSLKDRVEFMEANEYDFIHSYGSYYFDNGNIKPYGLTNPYAQFNSILKENGIMGGSTFYKTEILKENPLNEQLQTAEEWELHLRLLTKGYKLGFLDKHTYLYRRWHGQKSIGNLSPEYQAQRDKVKEEIRRWYTPQQ